MCCVKSFWIQINDPASSRWILSVENLELNTENINRQQNKWESKCKRNYYSQLDIGTYINNDNFLFFHFYLRSGLT